MTQLQPVQGSMHIPSNKVMNYIVHKVIRGGCCNSHLIIEDFPCAVRGSFLLGETLRMTKWRRANLKMSLSPKAPASHFQTHQNNQLLPRRPPF